MAENDAERDPLDRVDPELRAFAAAFPKFDPALELIPALRQASAQPLPECGESEPVEWRELWIERSEGPPVRVLLYKPRTAQGPVPVILHLHGGGFIAGQPEIAHDTNEALSRDLGVAIVAVNYRLAPEAPFPAALDDSYTVLRWIYEDAAAQGFDIGRIAVKGESAGGGLAAGLALLARDRGEYPIHFQCLTYPMLDDRIAADPNPHAGAFIWTEPFNRFGWHCYLGGGAGGPDISPYAAPARAEVLGGLPPTLILTGALDLFAEEDIAYARRLMRAGVPVELIVYPGVVHGFERAGETAIKARYQRDLREALGRALF